MTKGSILWADDEIEFLEPHVLFLKDKGYEVKTCTNGDEQIIAQDWFKKGAFGVGIEGGCAYTADALHQADKFIVDDIPLAKYFDEIGKDRLTEDGIALVHTIGRARPPGATSPWITKYIFPGGYCPSLSEVMKAVEHQGLIEADIEVWRLHYAKTLRHWHDRFMANIDKARALYDDRFCRMWRYYLVASELTFRLNRQVVFQLQLTKQQEAVPLKRDYLYQEDDKLRHAAE